jgi:two-component system, cell cycle sensor histidine kinase and response regulator CckA
MEHRAPRAVKRRSASSLSRNGRQAAPRPRSLRPPPARLLAHALRDLKDGVIIARNRFGPEGLTIAFANAAFCTMTGFDEKLLVGRGHASLHFEPEDLATLRRWHRRLAEDGSLTGEGYLRHKNGVSIYASWSFSPLADARGRITHIVGTYRDLTEKRRLQEALAHAQRLEAVGRLAGGVAHDFNNLLSVINGYCEILAETVADNPKARKEVAEIHRAGQRASTLVRQLLAFGRRQTMDPRVLNLNLLVRENAEILSRLLSPDKTLQLALDDAIHNVRADPSQLQQVLLNLTINARDALQPGGQVTISTSNREVRPGLNRRLTDMPPGRYVMLSVSDNGSGMDERTQAHLFEPFFTTKGEGKGTGLGLALVYGVVQQSGGYIVVHSVPGMGSTFEIYLPEVREPAVVSRGMLAPLPVTRGRETIVLAEGDEVVRKMVAGILTADGYRVLAAASPTEALQEARRHGQPVHLAIVDGAHAAGEGQRLVHSLRQMHPSLRVLCTSGDETAKVPGVLSKRQTVVPKPFALSMLLRAARSLLDA